MRIRLPVNKPSYWLPSAGYHTLMHTNKNNKIRDSAGAIYILVNTHTNIHSIITIKSYQLEGVVGRVWGRAAGRWRRQKGKKKRDTAVFQLKKI